ncbi:MAG: IS5 family transposase [Bacteroidota bacterium]
MIRDHSNKQLRLDLFETSLGRQLSPKNRWVELSQSLPWDDLCKVYQRSLSQDQGAPSKPARQVIGSLIIKHKLKLSDREVLAQIEENPYLQYFVGLDHFQHKPLFDPSLFVHFRKRMGVEAFEQMNQSLLIKAGLIAEPAKEKSQPPEDSDSGQGQDSPSDSDSVSASNSTKQGKESNSLNKGKLLIDAMVCEQMIQYPTDLDLVSRSRKEAERLIDLVYDPQPGKVKPRTYRIRARKDYLAVAKKRRKSKRLLRKALAKQLNYLRRDLEILKHLLEETPDSFNRLRFRDMKIYWVIQHIYAQQREMHSQRSNSCKDRIVNIYQPHVRPMVTGKAAKKTEFGAKSSVSLLNGFSSVHAIRWDNFHEALDLKGQVEEYKDRYGYYPEVVSADQKYGTRANRKWLKEKGIRFSGKALGRPKKNPQPEDIELAKLKKQEQKLRSQIEGKFGQGKNGYNLRTIRARLDMTSKSWIAAIFFVMNIKKFEELRAFALIFEQIITLFSPPDKARTNPKTYFCMNIGKILRADRLFRTSYNTVSATPKLEF